MHTQMSALPGVRNEMVNKCSLYVPRYTGQTSDRSDRFAWIRLRNMQAIRVFRTHKLFGRLVTKCGSVSHIQTRQAVLGHDALQHITAANLLQRTFIV